MKNISFIALVSLSGCIAPVDEPAATTDQALASEGTLWPTSVIPVCWETGLADDGSGQSVNPHTRADWSTLSRVVRDTMRSTWGRAANLEFTYFGDCPSNTASGNAGYVAINLAGGTNATGGNTDIGYSPGRWTRMRLDVDNYGGASSESFRGEVMHETGHALSFGHEWDRADNPHNTGCTVADSNYEKKTTTYYGTQFDILSIMNYSYDQGAAYCKLPQPFRLSAWDIVGVQNAYGRRKPGTLVAASGNCLDQPLPYSEGGGLQVWECNGGSNQAWKAGSNGTISAPALGAFVTVPWASTSPGVRLVGTSATSPQALSQVFHGAPSGYQLRGIGDTCLDVPSGSIFSGQRVQIYACNGGSNQRWRAFSDGTIRPAANTSYCVDVPSGAAFAGNLLQLYTCNGGASQRFTFTNAGEIRFGGLCADVVGGRPTDGSRVQLYSCKAAGDDTRVNQLWHLTASLANSNGLCVEAQGSTAANGAAVVQNTCSATTPGQTWDYYVSAFTGF